MCWDWEWKWKWNDWNVGENRETYLSEDVVAEVSEGIGDPYVSEELLRSQILRIDPPQDVGQLTRGHRVVWTRL